MTSRASSIVRPESRSSSFVCESAELVGLALLGVDLALTSLERPLALVEVFELAVEVLLFLLESLLLALDLGSTAAMLLFGSGPQANRLVLGLEEDLLGPRLGLRAQLC